MSAYYNEHDPYAAQWLRNLIKAGHIAPGFVDERSITDVKPEELRGFTQCHFFAGVGVWSLALRKAGWPDDKPVWTGSCPCQPFSAAGKGLGTLDERHLWPAWFHLITQCAPPVIFGEQVASKDGLGWLDLVQTDLEGAGYANAAADLCAAGVGAPHIRQRLWFVAERVAYTFGERPQGSSDVSVKSGGSVREDEWETSGRRGDTGGVADTSGVRLDKRREAESAEVKERREQRPECVGELEGRTKGLGRSCDSSQTNGLWRDTDWLFCRDGKWRPVRPGSFPLVNGAPSRVGRLRAYGNAINSEAATTFIAAYNDTKRYIK